MSSSLSRRRQLALVFGLALLTVGCDRVSKQLATAALKHAPARSYLGGLVRLEYAENRGGFLSVGAGLPRRWRIVVFELGGAVLLLAAAWVGTRMGLGIRQRMALTLIVAGGAANLLDRLAYGAVVDFLNLGIGGRLRTGIFNVADLAIAAGAAVLALSSNGREDAGPVDRRQ
jgi:signal peptidase II